MCHRQYKHDARASEPVAGQLTRSRCVLVRDLKCHLVKTTIVVFSSLVMIVSFGCGNSESERVPVSGTITLDGKPLASGAISFLPVGRGTSAGTTIFNGEFSITRASGPSPGRYRVEIDSYETTGEKIPDSDLVGRTTQRTRQVIPAKYNRESTWIVDVKSDGNKPFVFELRST